MIFISCYVSNHNYGHVASSFLIQPPDSLMLASIEARMRRLSKMAHSVAIHVTSLKRSLLLVGAVTTQDHTSFEPFCTNSTTSGSEHSMPEWKFFNKVCFMQLTHCMICMCVNIVMCLYIIIGVEHYTMSRNVNLNASVYAGGGQYLSQCESN